MLLSFAIGATKFANRQQTNKFGTRSGKSKDIKVQASHTLSNKVYKENFKMSLTK